MKINLLARVILDRDALTAEVLTSVLKIRINETLSVGKSYINSNRDGQVSAKEK